jgi:hypothetical protein|tara:strand:- start:19588 stop:19845 length:258 start_codon:yes stop_codon:yes gene_type:complete
MIITVKKDDGEVIYDVTKITDEAKQGEARVIISKVGNLDTVTEALSFASATHRANLERLLEDSPESIVEPETEVVEAEIVEEDKS